MGDKIANKKKIAKKNAKRVPTMAPELVLKSAGQSVSTGKK
jgi:hypothetical protein